MTTIGLYNSLFQTPATTGSGPSGAGATDDTGEQGFIAQLQQSAIDDAAPAAKIKATATALTNNAATSAPYTAIPVAAKSQAADTLQSCAASGAARQLATLTPSTGQTSFYTQSLAQQPATATAAPVAANTQTATDKFMRFASQSPIERMRGQILGGMGLTSQQVTQMSPAQQSKVETAVREKIRETMKKDMGAAAASAPQGAAAADILASA